ncbi:CoA-transferase subunit beta [Xanthomonas cucurbitae]|uniref:3-oxoadipate--succinyl-CoA transferase subunit B n=1 Tax=Xanthomonas cucurbitae TaxID=56453 RepID=A0A2S7DTG5_9XANT|nr:CoA-transferase subunit beta [Xanthomonas cucurbitae]PPU77124.1 3-oxoadipate--succinyl-CoA transferase subunit B [Xanthomonas cucurbitae]WDM67341.1 CoA-transferase subunit beta [Xanthomonas cucurbitae]WDM71218.1 CoA-transferase subunit beta [Xanthomonas cucurbitae]WDM79508.1 CoA-transferase subunit beta [Xanthomonas cucurbitae]WDM83197.1 CoA-transferase subunit beta [Xanthomonas cucurbitae]
MSEVSTNEMMTVAAARRLPDGAVCFVGIGLPSTAANLARLTHAPDVTLIYESGPIGARPDVLPLSIGDGELAETADTVVSTPEIFRYWLQGGRVDVGFLGAAQIDRHANLNTTVIGDYAAPKTRLPGAGGAPEIAASAKQVFIIMRQSRRSFVATLDFITTVGHLDGGDARKRAGLPGAGPTVVVTDLCVMEPDPVSRELTVTALHPGITREQVSAATGWPIRFADDLAQTPPPTATELQALRALQARTDAAHGTQSAGAQA